MGRVDVITGTLGKALGGASGGYTSGARRSSICSGSARGPICSLTPSLLHRGSLAARPGIIDIVRRAAREAVGQHASLSGEDGGEGVRHQARQPSHRSHHLGDAVLAQVMAARLLEKGSTSPGSSIPWCPRAPRASGCRYPRPLNRGDRFRGRDVRRGQEGVRRVGSGSAGGRDMQKTMQALVKKKRSRAVAG